MRFLIAAMMVVVGIFLPVLTAWASPPEGLVNLVWGSAFGLGFLLWQAAFGSSRGPDGLAAALLCTILWPAFVAYGGARLAAIVQRQGKATRIWAGAAFALTLLACMPISSVQDSFAIRLPIYTKFLAF